MSVQIITADALAGLAQLADGSVGCCVTSPPYWGLRNYGHPDQLGAEATPEEYVTRLVAIFREVRRVLRDDACLWLNLGDSYCSTAPGTRNDAMRREGGKQRSKGAFGVARPATPSGMKPKDLVGIPWMVAFALRADGWQLRQDVIWEKPNAMPESVVDRCTKSHEYLFLLTKARRYFFDAVAIAEDVSDDEETVARRARAGYFEKPVGNADMFGQPLGQSGRPRAGPRPSMPRGSFSGKTGDAAFRAVRQKRNARSVWSIATEPSDLPHFAMMPTALAERAILAGTSEHGCCPACGARWRRVTRPAIQAKHADGATASSYAKGSTAGRLALLRQAAREQGVEYTGARITTGWAQSCGCTDAGLPHPDRVLDPFGGAGTTALVAERLQRDAVLVELNPVYVAAARARLERDAPLFAQVAA